MTKFRKRPAVYIAIGGLVAFGVIGMLALFQMLGNADTERLTIVVAVVGNIVTGVVGLGNKAFESEEKGEVPDKDGGQ